MNKSFLLLSLILLVINPSVYCANILFYFGFSSYSHRIAVWPLVESLSAKGHNITFISSYPTRQVPPNPTIKEIVPTKFTNWLRSIEEADTSAIFESRQTLKTIFNWLEYHDFGYTACKEMLESEEIQTWIKTATYDLIVIDVLFNECAFGLAYKFKNASTILYSTSSLYPWLIEQYGLGVESSWIPDMLFPSADLAGLPYIGNLWRKIKATFVPLIWYFARSWNYFPRLDTLLREKLNEPNMPTIEELERNVSLMFINSYFTEEYARSLPPFVVPVGGAHCYKATITKNVSANSERLPKEMEDFLADNNFIYISFGTYADILGSPELQLIFLNTFRKLSHLKFIWKSKGNLSFDLPSNVLVTKWSPQQLLLGNSRIKAFITHGGLCSIHEAICFQVPIITLPIFAEQDYNSERIHRMEYGIQLEITAVTEQQLTNAIYEITTNSKYAKNIQKVSELFMDRQISPAETATWWTEYILRHRQRNNDISFLKPKSMDQSWYERRSIDIWGLVLVFLILLITIVSYGVKIVKVLIISSGFVFNMPGKELKKEKN